MVREGATDGRGNEPIRNLVINASCSAQSIRTLESEEPFKIFNLGSNRESQG